MNTRQDRRTELSGRCAAARRLFAFSLLALALLSYGSLPSQHPGASIQSHIDSAAANPSEDTERLLVPQQASEYRGRPSFTVIERLGGEQSDPLLCADVPVRLHSQCVSPVDLAGHASYTHELNSRPLPRGPPVGFIA